LARFRYGFVKLTVPTVELPPIEGFNGRLVKIRVRAALAGLDDGDYELCTCCEHSVADRRRQGMVGED